MHVARLLTSPLCNQSALSDVMGFAQYQSRVPKRCLQVLVIVLIINIRVEADIMLCFV